MFKTFPEKSTPDRAPFPDRDLFSLNLECANQVIYGQRAN